MGHNPVLYISWELGGPFQEFLSDGCTLHSCRSQVRRMLRRYNESRPEGGLFLYRRPTTGVPVTFYADDRLYERVLNSENGIRLSREELLKKIREHKLNPGLRSGGWMPKILESTRTIQ